MNGGDSRDEYHIEGVGIIVLRNYASDSINDISVMAYNRRCAIYSTIRLLIMQSVILQSAIEEDAPFIDDS